MSKERKLLMQKLVKEEATNLLKYAKKKELNNLNFERLNPESIFSCIYGQMTGDCFTDRSTKLITKCASRVYKYDSNFGNNTLKNNKINGSPKEEDRDDYWSPIEVFIATKVNQNNGNNKMLVDYLKGERKTLKFK